MEAAEARRAVNEAALARDRTALVALAASMPAIQAFAYERRRARAFAHALDGAGDAAIAELSLAAAAGQPSASTLAADSAQLHLLLGDPERAVVALEGAALVHAGLDPHAGAVLVAAIREAPAAWFRGARAAVLARSPRTTLATLGAAFDTVADRTVFRAGVAGAALAAAVLSFFTLPNVFFEGTSAAPRSGVTTPRSSAPPDVVVADVPVPAAPGLPTRERTRRTPTRPEAPAATLVSIRTTQPAADPFEEEQPPPGRPRASRPAPVSPRPPAPTPAPDPEPAPSSPPTPTPAPAPPPVDIPVASAGAAAPAAAPAPATVDPKKAKKKVKNNDKNDKDEKQHEHKTEEPAPPPPPAATAQSPAECEQDDQGEHGREREKDKEKRRDG